MLGDGFHHRGPLRREAEEAGQRRHDFAGTGGSDVARGQGTLEAERDRKWILPLRPAPNLQKELSL